MKTGLTNNGLCKTDRRHSSLRWGGSILVLGLLAASHAQAQSPFVQYQTAPTPAAPAPAAPGPAAPAAPLSNLSLSNVKDGITTVAPGAPPAPAASLLDITPADATTTETADRPSPPAEASPAAPPAQPPAGVASVTPAAPTQSIPSTSLPPINVTAPSAPPQPAPVTVGLDSPTVVDTATLKTADKVIGLYGIVGIKGEASQGLQSYLSAPADSHLTCQSQTGPEFVCLTPDGTDVAEVSLLNGAARAKEDAPLAYHEQEASAQAARRGIWSSLPPPPVVLQHPQIVDTATLVMGGQTYLLDGIDGVGAPYAPVMQSYIANAGDSLSCEAEANPGHFICVLPDGTDIAKVALVNGAARVTPDAPDSYRIQQLDAINNHRGMWVTPPPPDMMATLVVTDPADCCVLVAGDDGFDGITYVGGEPTAIIDGSTVFLTYAGDAGWGYYDGGHQWHDAPAAYSDHLNHFHPDAHGLRGKLLIGRVAPHDSCAGLRRDHEVKRVLKDQHPVCHRQRQCAARATLAGDDGNCRHSKPRHLQNVARDGFRLAAFLGAQTGIRPRQIDEADDRPGKFLRNFHAAQRLAIALGMRHAEIAAYAILGAAAFAVADHHDLFVAQARHGARDGLVVAIGAIPVNLAVIREDAFDKVHGIGALRMPRPLDSNPRRRNRLPLIGNPCLLFAHRYLVPLRARSPPALLDSTGPSQLGQIQLISMACAEHARHN